MHGPLILAGGGEAIIGQISTLADAHAGVANQQKRVTSEIIPAEVRIPDDGDSRSKLMSITILNSCR